MKATYYIERRRVGEMNRTHLIQRLNQPIGKDGDVTTPFSFGGGLLNGGISKEALMAMRGVFSFDYMGSAEFEFGSVPAALTRIARERESFVSGRIGIDPAEVKVPYRCKRPEGKLSVYFLAHKDEADQVRDIVRRLAKDEFKFPLKESCQLDRALCGDEYARSGWLEINNGFMFFVDRKMFERTAKMFGIGV